MLLTFQDFQEAGKDKGAFISQAITNHKASREYRIARDADLYDRQQNSTINSYVQRIFSLSGTPVEDFTASNSKIASNFFHRLNTQRCAYSLGNGVSFASARLQDDEFGGTALVDSTKQTLGKHFDVDLYNICYKGLIHGVSFGFLYNDRLYCFPLTEFVPFWDEYDGTLGAGVRFWQLAPDKPMMAVLYEKDGYTKYASMVDGDSSTLQVVQEKRPYILKIATIAATGDTAVVGAKNYSSLPIVPFWGSKLKQSTLVGMKQAIDSFDLIRSGFANDLTDCSQVYWIVENCGGMTDEDLARFRDRLHLSHIASIPNADEGAAAKPYTQDIPYAARKQYLDDIRAGIYEDFGGLDVHTIAAGATNDHIDAAYQPLDENADDFEYNVVEFIQQLLSLKGIENDDPIFKRNRISNQQEQVDMVLSAANYLDDRTILEKLPFITVDEVARILKEKGTEDMERFDDAQDSETE